MASRKPLTANPRVLTPEQDAELHAKANALLARLRRDMLNNRPFVGNLLMSLDVVPTRDIDNPTACTDGAAIYFDIAFLSSLSPEEAMFVFAHEVWHNVMRHSIRLEDRDARMFNIATDLEINQLLVKDGFAIPKMALMPHKYGFPKDLSAEQYYDLLKQECRFQNFGGGGAANEDEADGGGSSDGSLSGQFDVHVYEGKSLRQNDNINGQDKFGAIGHDKEFRPNATESAVNNMRDAAIMVIQQMERMGRGDVPAHLTQLVNKLTEPEIRWQDVLCQHITRVMGDKPDWNYPNRRFAYNGLYLSSHHGEKIRIAVGIDTSGSTSGSMHKFLGELNSIVKSFGNYELQLIECDAKVGKVENYDDDNPLDLENSEIHVTGGGGTYLHPIFEKIAEDKKEIDTIVIFTDGEVEEFPFEDNPGIPVLWVITNDGQTDRFHFGETVMFKEK